MVICRGERGIKSNQIKSNRIFSKVIRRRESQFWFILVNSISLALHSSVHLSIHCVVIQCQCRSINTFENNSIIFFLFMILNIKQNCFKLFSFSFKLKGSLSFTSRTLLSSFFLTFLPSFLP